MCHTLSGLPPSKGFIPPSYPGFWILGAYVFLWGQKGRQSQSCMLCCSLVLTHFPWCVAVLGIPRHIVLVPNGLQQVLSGSFGCLSSTHCWSLCSCYSLSLWGLCRMRLSHPKYRPHLDLGFSQHFWTLLPRHEKHSGSPLYHTKATGNWSADTSPSAKTPLSHFGITSWMALCCPNTMLNMEWKWRTSPEISDSTQLIWVSWCCVHLPHSGRRPKE